MKIKKSEWVLQKPPGAVRVLRVEWDAEGSRAPRMLAEVSHDTIRRLRKDRLQGRNLVGLPSFYAVEGDFIYIDPPSTEPALVSVYYAKEIHVS